MLKAGYFHNLKVSRFTSNGAYLCDEESQEVLLPNRYVPTGCKEGDELDVFVYHDSEDRLIATTVKPFAESEQAAYMEVIDEAPHGAFLSWGIMKDLFVPLRNQLGKMKIGQKYIVYVYTDNITGRVVASARLNSHISNRTITVDLKEEVDILVAEQKEIGYRVIINNKHWGIIYSNQIFRPIKIGDRMRAYVRKITEDGRIDVALDMEGFDQVQQSANTLLEMIKQEGGRLQLNDKSSPELIYQKTNMSKKSFKRAVGYLLSNGKIAWDADTIVAK